MGWKAVILSMPLVGRARQADVTVNEYSLSDRLHCRNIAARVSCSPHSRKVISLRRRQALRAVIGKESLVKSLGTGNRSQASRFALPYIAEFKSRIAEAASTANYRLKAWGPADRQYRYHITLNRTATSARPICNPPATNGSPRRRRFEALQVEFDMDPASPGRNAVPWIPAKKHLTKADDGLTTQWEGFVWLNPPYGLRNGMQKWIDRFVEHGNGVILLPIRNGFRIL